MNSQTKRVSKKALPAVLAGLTLLSVSIPRAHADTPGPHPLYIHALSDLRAARAFLTAGQRQNVEQNEGAAIIEIDQSLTPLKRAAADDGKNLQQQFPVDTSLSRRDRLNRALAALGKARQDINRPEADPSALGWQREALVHIGRAYDDTQRALQDNYFDNHPLVGGSHAHFLHAIANLRAARGLLISPDGGIVSGDEQAASQSLTDAIRSAKRGSVDDGLDVFYNPAPATNVPHHNRLVQALKLIQDARYEETHYAETDRRTDSALYQAVAATDRASLQVSQALRDLNQ